MFLILAGEESPTCGYVKILYPKTYHGNRFWKFVKVLGEDKDEACLKKMIKPLKKVNSTVFKSCNLR